MKNIKPIAMNFNSGNRFSTLAGATVAIAFKLVRYLSKMTLVYVIILRLNLLVSQPQLDLLTSAKNVNTSQNKVEPQ